MLDFPKYLLYGLSGLGLGVTTGGLGAWGLNQGSNYNKPNFEELPDQDKEENLGKEAKELSNQDTGEEKLPSEKKDDEETTRIVGSSCGKDIWWDESINRLNDKGNNFNDYLTCTGLDRASVLVQHSIRKECEVWSTIPSIDQDLSSYPECERKLWAPHQASSRRRI